MDEDMQEAALGSTRGREQDESLQPEAIARFLLHNAEVLRNVGMSFPNLPKSALIMYDGFGGSVVGSTDRIRPRRISRMSKVASFETIGLISLMR